MSSSMEITFIIKQLIQKENDMKKLENKKQGNVEITLPDAYQIIII